MSRLIELPGRDREGRPVLIRPENPVSIFRGPFDPSCDVMTVPQGMTMAEIVDLAEAEGRLDPAMRDRLIVRIGGYRVDAPLHLVRPNPGIPVSIDTDVPGESGRKVLRTILLLAIVVVSAIVAPQIAGALFPTLQGAALAAATAAVAGVLTVAGTLALNALLPPQLPKLADETGAPETSAFFSGSRNRLVINGPIPSVLGQHRHTPPHCAFPYTEPAGEDQYLRMLLCWGQGPLALDQETLKIGETLFGEFDDVEHEFIEGWPRDPRTFLPAAVTRNLLLWSDDFTNAAWTDPSSEWTVVGDSVQAPDGGMADVITITGTAGLIRQILGADPGATISGSVWAMVISGTCTGLTLDFGDGNAQNVVAQLVANQWVRLEAPKLVNGGVGDWLDIRPTFSAAGGEIALWRASLEQQATVGACAYTESAEAGAIEIFEHSYQEEHVVTFDSDGALPAPLEGPAAVTATAATDEINWTSHPMVVGQPCEFETDGTLPAGLRVRTRYWVVEISTNAFKVATEPGGVVVDLEDAGTGTHTIFPGYYVAKKVGPHFQVSKTLGGTILDLTTQGTGTHSVERLPERITTFTDDVFEDTFGGPIELTTTFQVRTTQSDAEEASFDITFPIGLYDLNNDGDVRVNCVVWQFQYSRSPLPEDIETFDSGDVTTGSDTITIAGHDFVNGQTATLSNAGGELPAPLAEDVDYFFVGVSGDDFKLALTVGGDPIDLTDGGSGTHTITRHFWESGKIVATDTDRLLPAPPGTKYVNPGPEEGAYWAVYGRYDLLWMDHITAEIKVLKGAKVEVGRDSPFFTFPTPGPAPGTPTKPSVPAGQIGLAYVYRQGDDPIAAGDITDIRPSDAPFDVTGGEFLVTATAPASGSVQIAGGTFERAEELLCNTTLKPFIHNERIIFPTAGKWDVRIRRSTPDASGTKSGELMTWTALRSFSNKNPVVEEGLALSSIRLKRNAQLGGSVEAINGVPYSIVREWNGLWWDWVQSQNPAALHRHILQGWANVRPLADARVNMTNLEDWTEYCNKEGWTYNRIFDFRTSVDAALRECAAAGRAAVAMPNATWGVVIDRLPTGPVQMFTPRNSFRYRGQRLFPDLPDGLRVAFANADEEWRIDELIVPRDGFTAATAEKLEGMEFPGVTDPSLLYRHGRFALAQVINRPLVDGFYTDFEGLICTRGDCFVLAHDVIERGLNSGRLKEALDYLTGTATSASSTALIDSGATFVTDGAQVGDTVLNTTSGASMIATAVAETQIDGQLSGGTDNDWGIGDGYRVEASGGDVSVLRVDTKITMEAGPSYGIAIRTLGDAALTAQVTNVPGETTELALVSPIPVAQRPYAGDLFGFGLLGLETSEQLLTGITPRDGMEAAITSVPLARAIYSYDAPPVFFLPTDVDTVTGTILKDNHPLIDDTEVTFSTTDTLPSPLSAATTYFVVNADEAGFQVSLTKGGGAVLLTSQGSGKHLAQPPIPAFTSGITYPVGYESPAILEVLSDHTVALLTEERKLVPRIAVRIQRTGGSRPDVAYMQGRIRQPPTTAEKSYLVAKRWTVGPQVPANEPIYYFIDVRVLAKYEFQLRWVLSDGTPLEWGTAVLETVEGKTIDPADVTGFSAQQNGDVVTLRWNEVAEPDIDSYEIRYGKVGVTWQGGRELASRNHGVQITTVVLPPGTWDLMIKARDSSDPGSRPNLGYSANEARISGFLMVQDRYEVLRTAEHKFWGGPTILPSPIAAEDKSATGNDLSMGTTNLFGPAVLEGLGDFSMALDDGVSSGSIPNDAAYTTSTWTVSFGLTIRHPGDDVKQFLIQKGTTEDNSVHSFQFAEGAYFNHIRMFHNTGGLGLFMTGWTELQPGQRYVVAGRLDGSAIASLFIDGVRDYNDLNWASPASGNSTPWAVKTGNGKRYLIDNLAMWDRALSDAEIVELCGKKLTAAQIADSSLVGYWDMYEGFGTTHRHRRFACLYPQGLIAAQEDPGQEVFDNFVWEQAYKCIYEGGRLDVGFDDFVRVHAAIQCNEGGADPKVECSHPNLEISHSPAAGGFTPWEPWTIGYLTGRFVRQRIAIIDESMYFTEMETTIDIDAKFAADEVTVSVAGTGVAVTYKDKDGNTVIFHTTPTVRVSAKGGASSPRFATYESVTTTGFTLRIWDDTGTAQTGDASYEAWGD